MNLTYLLAAVLIGAAFAAQPAINGVAARGLGSVLPATVLSVGITLVASALIMIASRTTPSGAAVFALPWWIFLGGLIGVLVVAGSAAIVPVTGAAMFFVCLIAGQLLGSVALDHFGAFGLPEIQISPIRVIGVLLALAGVLLVQFGGPVAGR